MKVLTVNAGSSSLKLGLVGDGDELLVSHELSAPRSQLDRNALKRALDEHFTGADAVAHRIVHGGERFRGAVRIDPEVVTELRALTDLAPLHQPKSLAALDAVGELAPGLPAVACFDTAFHQTIAPAAFTYALPSEWRRRWGLRRYGFHGLSHGWIARRAPELLAPSDPSDVEPGGDGADGGDGGDGGNGGDGGKGGEGGEGGRRIVSCHLGAGASLCAIRRGESVDTTMGFTPLEGLVMATRSGSVDPGLLLWLLEHESVSEHEMASALEHDSGLLGLAGSADMAAVIERAAGGEEQAAMAIDVYVHRLCAGIAAMAAALGGLDTLVFTGGIGEHAPVVRSRAARGMGFLGVALDDARNADPTLDAEIGVSGAPVRTLVIRAREDLEMARQAREALAS